MRFFSASAAAAVLAFVAMVDAAGHGHAHGHHRHHHQHRDAHADVEVEKRGGKCQFPAGEGLIPITPHMQNAGWAKSPNQPCEPGNYCPYACPSGQVSMQWDPEAKSYTYPLSTNGGLFCDENGNMKKPFPDRPYCRDGTGTVGARNKCGKEVSFCQTVLPGNEAMLIPTSVKDVATLAVPGTDYWCETAAHYYINPPGIGTETGCVWGTSANPYGNWSPYVAGANTVSNGDTYLKIGWNPIYLEPTTPFRHVVPDFGIEIECEDGCNGMPCKIDPAVNGVNEMIGDATVGAGGATFCVVTVPKGKKAHVAVFERGGNEGGEGGNGGGNGGDSSTPPAPPSTSSTSTSSTTASSTTSTPTPTPTTTSTSSSTSTWTPTPTPSSTSSSSTSTEAPTPSWPSSSMAPPSMSPSSSIPSSSKWPMKSPSLSYSQTPPIFAETGTPTSMSTASPMSTETSAASSITSSMSLCAILGVLALVVV